MASTKHAGARISVDTNDKFSSDNSTATQAAYHVLFHVTQNEMMVHQLLLKEGSVLHQDGLDLDEDSLSGSGDTESAALLHVAGIAQKAFWDVVRDELASSPPGWPRLVSLLLEARGKLLEVIGGPGPQATALRNQLMEQLEPEYMLQRLEAGLDGPYLLQLFDCLVHFIRQLEAPARNEDTVERYGRLSEQLHSAFVATAARNGDKEHVTVSLSLPSGLLGNVLSGMKDHRDNSEKVSVTLGVVQSALPIALVDAMIAALRFVLDKVSELRMDVARYRLEVLRGMLQHPGLSGVEYERGRFDRAVEAAGSVSLALPRTSEWLMQANREEGATLGESVSGRSERERQWLVVVHGLLSLIGQKQAVDLVQCPETWLLDCGRIRLLQNELQRLALTAACGLLSQELVGAQGVRLTPQRRMHLVAAVQSRLLVLLASPDVNMEGLVEELTMLVDQEACAASGNSATPSSRSLVSGLLRRVTSPEDPVLLQLQRRLLEALRLLLTAAPGSDLRELARGVLQAMAAPALLEPLLDWARSAKSVARLNFVVCEPYYDRILMNSQAEE